MTKSHLHHPTFPPLPAWLFYLLSFTLGLPMSLVGGIVYLILRAKQKPTKAGYCLVFDFPNIDWGVSLGFVIIAPTSEVEFCKFTKHEIIYTQGLVAHEHGHAIQNAYLGFLFPFLVAIPSFIRFWWREWKKPNTDYDAIWFEGSATKTGQNFFEKFFEKYLDKLEKSDIIYLQS